ncbi:sigma-70 family RNA polymerase sigma factor [Gimesia sp.]|uniref:sigma-70 family RNA polymerase sigma factor n=1 Tax=Gimesia sp. TaxID=2024833 RepID=UPI003A930846
MCDEQEDPEIFLNRLQENPEGVLADEYNRYRERLWRIVNFRLDTRLLGRVDADDILQEAYLDASTRIGHYLNDPATTFFIWLRTIVGQTLIDVHRRHLGAQKRDVRREVNTRRRVFSASTSFQIANVLLGDMTSPSQAALKEELAIQLREALESLNEIDREILVLRHFEELSNLEASEVLEIEPKTASMRYFRALTRLRSILVQIPGIID